MKKDLVAQLRAFLASRPLHAEGRLRTSAHPVLGHEVGDSIAAGARLPQRNVVPPVLSHDVGDSIAARARLPQRSVVPPVLGRDVGLDLGRPGSHTCAGVLCAEAASVVDGRLTRAGGDLGSFAPGSAPSFAFIAVVAAAATTDLISLRSAFLRCGDVPGVSPRAAPGCLWIRIHRDVLAAGLGLAALAEAVHGSLSSVPGVAGVEFLAALGDDDAVTMLRSAATAAEAQAGTHTRLRFNATGDLECNDLTCKTCDEQPVCDGLRDVLRIRRAKRSASHV